MLFEKLQKDWSSQLGYQLLFDFECKHKLHHGFSQLLSLRNIIYQEMYTMESEITSFSYISVKTAISGQILLTTKRISSIWGDRDMTIQKIFDEHSVLIVIYVRG